MGNFLIKFLKNYLILLKIFADFDLLSSSNSRLTNPLWRFIKPENDFLDLMSQKFSITLKIIN